MENFNTDKPCAPQELIANEPKPIPTSKFEFAHTSLVVLAALPFLSSLILPLLLFFSEEFVVSEEYLQIVQFVVDFPFVVGYIGLFFRKGWAYWLCAVIAGIWVAEMLFISVFTTWFPYWRSEMMSNLTIFAVLTMWYAVIALLAMRCAMTRRRQKTAL